MDGKKNIFIGTEDFKSLITTNSYYVDKTKIIEDMVTKPKAVFLFPRPRRFGKTLMMSTLDNFFNIEKRNENKDLFKGLYIDSSKSERVYEYKNNYPVIFLSFKELKKNNFQDTIEQFRYIIFKLYNSKTYLKEVLTTGECEQFDLIAGKGGSIIDLENSLINLITYMYKYYNKKVIVLIDEYDVPIQEGYLNGFYDEIVEFIRSILSSSLKTNEALEFGVVTGALRVSRESIFTGFNNPDVYTMMDKGYREYFGFTEEETKELLEYYQNLGYK